MGEERGMSQDHPHPPLLPFLYLLAGLVPSHRVKSHTCAGSGYKRESERKEENEKRKRFESGGGTS